MKMNLKIKTERQPGEEGIFRVTNAYYHASDGVSSSSLKNIMISPADFIALQEEEKKTTKAMEFGTAFHTWMLEPDEIKNEIAIITEPINRRTKEGKAKYEDLTRGKIVIQGDDLNLLNNMAMSCSQHEKWPKLLDGSHTELSFYKIIDDVMCKCRPDILRDNLIADLKTFQGLLTDDEIAKEIALRKYHFSAAMYLEIVSEIIADFPENWLWVFCSKQASNQVRFITASQMDLKTGKREFREALRIYRKCIEEGEWPGFPQKLQTIELPRWYKEFLGAGAEA